MYIYSHIYRCGSTGKHASDPGHGSKLTPKIDEVNLRSRQSSAPSVWI